MKKPELNEVPLSSTMIGIGKSSVNITMSRGQWDGFLRAAYDAGHNLIEVDENEIPVRAYKKRPGIKKELDETLNIQVHLIGKEG